MKEYLKHEKIVERKKPSKLLGIVIAVGLIVGTGIACYAIVSNPFKYTGRVNPQEENIPERRARFLNYAEEQLKNAQNPEEINGLNSVIKSVESGAYDYAK